MSPPTSTSASGRTTLNEDLYGLIIAQHDKKTNWDEIQQLSLVCRTFRMAIAPVLFEKLRYNIHKQWNWRGNNRPLRCFLRRVGRHVRHLHLESQHNSRPVTWSSIWDIFGVNILASLRTLTITSDALPELAVISLPRTRDVVFPQLVHLTIPLIERETLQILCDTPRLHTLCWSYVDWNLMKRIGRLLWSDDKRRTSPAVEAGDAFEGTGFKFSHKVPVIGSLRILQMGGWGHPHSGVDLVDTLRLVRRLFPNVERVEGHGRGVPGFLSPRQIHHAVGYLELLSRLQHITLLFRPSRPDNQDYTLFEGSEKHGLFGIKSGSVARLHSDGGPFPEWYTEKMTPREDFKPQPDFIRRELDPVVQAFRGSCPTLGSLRHIYDTSVAWDEKDLLISFDATWEPIAGMESTLETSDWKLHVAEI